MHVLQLVPFVYFLSTRLKLKLVYVFQILLELGGAVVITFLLQSSVDLINCVALVLIHYMAFISIYEIGYLINDTYAAKKESNPTKRLYNHSTKRYYIAFILIRIGLFSLITIYLSYLDKASWWIFYLLLITMVALHNAVYDPGYRLATFSNTAILRVIAPIYFLIPLHYISTVLYLLSASYSLYRLLSYAHGKGLLYVNQWKSVYFKLYTLTIIVMAPLTLLFIRFLD